MNRGDTAIDSVRIANTVDVPPGTKLVVAEQNATQSLPWNLANAGKDAPYAVEFADFSGGAAVIEALRSGAADVGSIGEAPVPIAVDSGVTDLVTIGLQANPGTSGGYYLVARPNSGITSIEQLRGKRVAYPPGSGRQMITAGAAQTARSRPARPMCSRWNSLGPRWFRRSPPGPSTRRSCSATSTTSWASRRSSATATESTPVSRP